MVIDGLACAFDDMAEAAATDFEARMYRTLGKRANRIRVPKSLSYIEGKRTRP